MPHGKHAIIAFTHTHARMLKHKTYRVLQAKIETILEIMHDPKYTEKPKATHVKMQPIAGSAILNMAYGMLQLTCIQLGIEIQMQLV